MTRDPIFETRVPAGGPLPWSGSEASRDRAIDEADSGTATWRQERVIDMLATAGPMGLTYREICTRTGWVGGQATGALSSAHKAGLISRLKYDPKRPDETRRNNCSIYVANQFVAGRVTAAQGRHQRRRDVNTATDALLVAQEEEIAVAREYIAALEHDLAELAGELDSIRNLAGEQAGRLRDLERAQGHLEEALTQLDLLKLKVYFLQLDREERERFAAIEVRVTGAAGTEDETVVRIRMGTLRWMTGVIRRLNGEPDTSPRPPADTDDAPRES